MDSTPLSSSLAPKRAAESATDMTQVVLPNDANILGFMLGGTVMHLIDMAGAVCAHRHARARVVTAAVDGLQFLHSIKIGDVVLLKAHVTAAFRTSMEVQVDVFSEDLLTGERQMTTHAYLTFVAVNADHQPTPVPPLILETDDERRKATEAAVRRAARLEAKQRLVALPDPSA